MIRRVVGGLKVLLRTRFRARFEKIKLPSSGPETWIAYLKGCEGYEIPGYMDPGLHLKEDNHAGPARGVRRISVSRKNLRRLMLIMAAVILFIVMRQVMNPFGDKDYVEVPHGNHVHYVPKDRDHDVPLSRFPTEPPAENERILPDGRVVPK